MRSRAAVAPTHHDCPSCLPRRHTRIPVEQRWCESCQRIDDQQRARMAELERASRVASSRSGAHTSPRVIVSLDPEILARIDALCEEGGISRSEWLREAARAYLILVDKDRLTEADWRRVVGG